ncbi:hypothetical protein AB2B46_23725 (plasmid) [Kluyvera intermedia]|uniref:hypothetical protein n=1 Tax=Kluyvera intermedia TaxID=61648 RepID=UPI0034A16171|nr:hypothetical protein [Enterobacter hormaechei subsp. steigerwaltii]
METSQAIAALKIYVTFCLFGKDRGDGVRTVEFTFSEISEIASLSRSLVNSGLKLLYEKKLIENLSLTKRKKIYTVDVGGEVLDGWCKLPMAGVVSDDRTILAFQSMHNRYHFELVALQLYLYLLYARDNKQEYVLARKQTMCKKLDCRLPDLNKAITYLIHIGLLKNIKQKAVESYPVELFHDSFYFYMKTGSNNALTFKK